MSGLPDWSASRDTVASIREQVFFQDDSNARRYARFWVLMVISSALAAAGVVADSTPAVIGAMIVSPFITPMRGVMLGVALSDGKNLMRSVALVLAGTLAAVALGVLLGLAVGADVVAEVNPQVASRVNPGVFDLVVALLAGVVGAIALIREDVSSAIAGVAIAVTLVPALAVAGLTLESGAFDQALGALLNFGSNAVAIIAAGTVTMLLYGVRRSTMEREGSAGAAGDPVRGRVAAGAVLAVLIAAPLVWSGVHLVNERSTHTSVVDTAKAWAESEGVRYASIESAGADITVTFEADGEVPDMAAFGDELEAAGVDRSRIIVRVVQVSQSQL